LYGDLGVLTPPAGEFSHLSAFDGYACAVRTDGELACWGADETGETVPPEGSFQQVQTGLHRACATRDDGRVACWGARATPRGKFHQVVGGDGPHLCALQADGTARCWGANDQGQATAPCRRFTELSVGVSFSCGIRTDGAVECWGSNAHGEASPPQGKFRRIASLSDNVQTCGILRSGSLACWGPALIDLPSTAVGSEPLEGLGIRQTPAGDFSSIAVGRLGEGLVLIATQQNGSEWWWGSQAARQPIELGSAECDGRDRSH
jgi:Regulator of chromosome condensation (RCC1) repeat